jgi:hypothetical protein
MHRVSGRLVLGLSAAAFGFLLLAANPLEFAGLGSGQALADAPDSAEKDAFEAAKELGTADAWNAFLANYATGFHADLARAYLKKLGDPPPAAAALPPTDDFPIVAGSWGGIVRDGPGQTYRKVDSLEEGQQVTLMGRSDVIENGFPWFKIAYGDDGKGFQWGGILCSTGPERPDIFKTCPPAQQPRAQEQRAQPTAAPVKKGCANGRVVIDGKCMDASAAVSYCGPGYRPQGGKCVLRSQPVEKKASKSACPKGQVWNAQEGCHYDD